MHRAIWGVVGVALVAGCGSAASEGDNREVIELTTGSRRDALYALAAARNLVLGLDRGDLAAVSEAAIRLGSGSSAITFGEPLATEAAVTRFEEPRPVPKPGVTSCQPTGCDYAHYRDNAFYPNLIDGSITVTTEPGIKRVTIDLVVRNDGWAVAEAGYLTGQLEIAAGALNGGVTEVTEYVDGASDHQQVRFDGVAFDEAAAASDEPPFGAISAEWDSPQYPRKGATISFP